MNYLAHLYLSGDDPDLRIGNFIADSVKGRNLSAFPPKVQRGIVLHRFIDEYTDHSPLLAGMRLEMRMFFPKYYGMILDVYLDHFLAKKWNQYSEISLRAYVRHFYLSLVLNYFILPQRIRKSLPYLISQNWLESYKEFKGLGLIFDRMNKFRGLPYNSVPVIDYLKENYEQLNEAFDLFFADLQIAVKTRIVDL